MKKLLQINGFLIGVMVAVGLAWLLPDLGAKGGLLRSEISTRIGVFIIFVIQGLTLPTNELKQGLLQVRLHAVCQLSIFLWAPILLWLVLCISESFIEVPSDLRVGFYFLAILPTTVSTAIVFTSKAEGNVAGALFNTSVANVLGVFIVPLFMTFVLKDTVAGADAGQVLNLLGKISQIILVPLIIGQVLRIWYADWAKAKKKALSKVNVYIIYFMIYAAFCNSVKKGLWNDYGLDTVGIAFGLSLLFLLLMTGSVYLFSRILKFDTKNQTTILFCGAQKTLAAGVPMANTIFIAERPELGLVLLPIMFYHPSQILLGSYLMSFFEKKVKAEQKRAS
ncbi:MAG: bile acid:sodium symporter family protein [Pseudomonadota bacterium]